MCIPEFLINGIIEYEIFCAWLISFKTISVILSGRCLVRVIINISECRHCFKCFPWNDSWAPPNSPMSHPVIVPTWLMAAKVGRGQQLVSVLVPACPAVLPAFSASVCRARSLPCMELEDKCSWQRGQILANPGNSCSCLLSWRGCCAVEVWKEAEGSTRDTGPGGNRVCEGIWIYSTYCKKSLWNLCFFGKCFEIVVKYMSHKLYHPSSGSAYSSVVLSAFPLLCSCPHHPCPEPFLVPTLRLCPH